MRHNVSAVVNQHGEPHCLELQTKNLQRLGNKDVIVKILMAGVGWADIMARRGGYPMAPKPPFIPGYDFSGIVEEVGNQVSEFKVGDYVVGLNPQFGCYSQYLSIAADLLVKFPKHLDPAQVCSLPLNYLTAYCMLFNKANIQSQQSILVHSAAGGVGSALVQLAKRAGVKVIGTTSSSKRAMIDAQGVISVDYKTEDFVQVVKTKYPQGVDAAFDPIGGKNLNRSFSAIKQGGIVVSYGFSGGQFGGLLNMISGSIQLCMLNLIPNGKNALFCALPSEVNNNKQWYRKALSSLIVMLDRKEIEPIVSHIVPLDKAHQAHALLESGNTIGKVVIQCTDLPSKYQSSKKLDSNN
ncbi:Alcohol dehydrogenase zinc-binding domain protein [Vibrio ichthyoenteri ATCC 700023]|uniref:Alcohol dehydrogenase zinc-binding domain protein n=1 Tax=Vibrio ichthyoenteri ATCC 700023 TaxID=870968 RepID=F9S6R3_9VIBR|nr:zinc-binding dehydrogenase [Vibrio ichthyoenteri]EGU32613.1 Alcohol dehydrogenase zinc-binding domain protein [Vibrio ichthyoenteri ATCC 700023]